MIKQTLTTTAAAMTLCLPLLTSCTPENSGTSAKPVSAQNATTWPASEASSFAGRYPEMAVVPDIQVPESDSIEGACDKYFAASTLKESIEEIYDPKILKEAYRVRDGEITEDEYKEITRPWQQEVSRGERRYLAAQVGVLKAAGYSDWKMYSRYSIDGVGDLWESNIINGEKVANNESHPDYRYTYSAMWGLEIIGICKPYR